MKSLIAALAIVPLSALAGSKQPNILFIAIDDLKPDLACYGVKQVISPNIDRLAQSGVVFTNSHCNQAICGPSRVSLLTGLRPDRTKVHDLKTQMREVNQSAVTIPEHFKKNGYLTMGVGKIYDPRSVDKKLDAASWSVNFKKSGLPFNSDHPEPAIAHYQSKSAQVKLKEIKATGLKQYGPIMEKMLAAGEFKPTECEDVPDDAYTDGAIAKVGINYIRKAAKQDKPFFIAVGFKKPHLPFVAPKKYWDLYKRSEIPLAKFTKFAEGTPAFAYHDWSELRKYSGMPKKGAMPDEQARELIHGYYACISYIDAQVGLLLQTLKSQKLDENTIVILWGDHGWHLGDHGIWCKHSNLEQATRSPLIIAGPTIKQGLKSAAPTEFVDIYPSLCELANIPTPNNLDGISFKPVITGAKKNVRDTASSQFSRGPRMGYTFRNDQFRYVVWFINKDKNTPLSDWQKPIAQELYDYTNDPHETKNLASDAGHQERIKSFQAVTKQHLIDQAKRIALIPSK